MAHERTQLAVVWAWKEQKRVLPEIEESAQHREDRQDGDREVKQAGKRDAHAGQNSLPAGAKRAAEPRGPAQADVVPTRGGFQLSRCLTRLARKPPNSQERTRDSHCDAFRCTRLLRDLRCGRGAARSRRYTSSSKTISNVRSNCDRCSARSSAITGMTTGCRTSSRRACLAEVLAYDRRFLEAALPFENTSAVGSDGCSLDVLRQSAAQRDRGCAYPERAVARESDFRVCRLSCRC